MSVQRENMSLLYIEDEDCVRESMAELLSHRFRQVWQAENGMEGLKLYREKAPDIVITDIRMPVMDGLEMARAILEHDDKAAIIVTSAHNESNYLLEAIEIGITNYLLKPLEWDKVEAALRRCVESVRKERDARERENSMLELSQRINAPAGISEKHTAASTGQSLDMEQQLDQMIEDFLGNAGKNASNRPDRIMTILLRGSLGDPEWFCYETVKNGRIRKTRSAALPVADKAIISANQALFYFNRGERLPDDPLLGHVLEHLSRCGVEPGNMVWHCNGCRIILAVNYSSAVTTCDAEAIKSLAVYACYLDSLLLQQHQTEEAFRYTITSLARAAEVNDEDTGNHILRVGEYCAAICRRIGLPKHLADAMALQSQLHDVGKIHIPPGILKKRGGLTAAEMELMRNHTAYGARIIGGHPRLESARSIALHHHERWDGSGYPSGLTENRIPLDARIVAIADVYDALRSRRSYKRAFGHDTACRVILEGDGRTEPSHFDPSLLDAFKAINGELEEIYERLAMLENGLQDRQFTPRDSFRF